MLALAIGLVLVSESVAAAPMRSFTATGPGGVRLHAWVSKARAGAPTLIVINGGPGLSHLAAPPAAVLARTFRVVFYDQRGTGQSSTPRNGAFDLPHQVGDLEALRRELGAARIDLLGHSFGGLVAAAYAARYPHRVSRMVLAGALPADASAIPRVDLLIARRLAALIASGVIPTPLPPVVGNDCTALASALAVASLATPTTHRPPYLPPGTCNQATKTQTRAAITAALCNAVRAHLRRYRGRVLILFGKQDPRRSVFQHLDQAEVPSAHTQVQVLPHSGHDTWIENRQFFPTIRRFLAQQ